MRFDILNMTNVILLLFCVSFSLLLLPVSGVQCPLQGSDAVALCPMCSQSNAAVRWTAVSKSFDFFELVYNCYYPNDTIIYKEDSDSCFNGLPISSDSSSRTGVSSIGHELHTGIRCTFRGGYRLKKDDNPTILPRVECTIQSPEMCAANPDECHVDRVSVMNEDDECPEYQCAEGYIGKLCNNIDECATSNECSDHANCNDTDGSYWCECWSGFQGDGYNCTDINECETVNETCSNVNAECVNSVGSYSCQCKQGYTGDGDNCTDINECSASNECSELSYCHNTNGSYWCECWPGFKGNGRKCTDINECYDMKCSNENAECINTVGNYSCQCMEGYTGDGYNCTDVDECFKGSYICPNNTNCTNIPGGYQCTVDEAFESTYNVAGMVSGIVLGSLLLLLLVLSLVIMIKAINHNSKRKKRFNFHDIATMELDPFYTPSFCHGSLSSIHSKYEKLVSSKTMTISNSLRDTNVSSEDQILSDAIDQVSAPTVDSSDRENIDDHNDETQEHNNKLPMDIISVTSSTNADNRDILVALGVSNFDEIDSETVHKISAGYTSEVRENEALDSEMTVCEAARNCHKQSKDPVNDLHHTPVNVINGYVSEDSSVSDLRTKTCTECAGPDTTDYKTESVSSDSDRHTFCCSETLKQDQTDSECKMVYVTSIATSASGSITSESTYKGTVQTSSQLASGLETRLCNKQTVLNTFSDDDNTPNVSISNCSESQPLEGKESTDIQDDDLENVKFTINPHQEFEYVNTTEEALSGIIFEITPVQ